MKKFYLHGDSGQQGPFDLEELKSKNIIKTTPIWYDGLTEWTTAENVEELKDLFSITPPPFSGTQPKVTNTPPPFAETNTSEYMAEFPEKTKSKKWIYWTIGVAVIALIAFLIFQNKSTKEKAEVVTQQTEATQSKVDELQKQLKEKNDQDKQAAEAATKKEEENQRKVAELETKKKNLRNNWSSFITATRNQYTYREIGGIYDLKITVMNNTEYELNEVVVNVDIIKANGGILKTEQLTFNNISPRSSKIVSCPDSDRGKSVNYHFEKIYSKELELCYDPYKDATAGSIAAADLWKCR